MSTVTPKILFNWFVKDLKVIVVAFLLFAVASVYYALSIPNKYSSSAKVSSNLSSNSGAGGALGKMSGLASLAGISVGGAELSPEVLKEMLNSNSFLASFIRAHQLEPILLASKEYKVSTDSFVFDNELYDESTDAWIRQVKFPLTPEPSDSELVIKMKEHFTVGFERKTKIITLSMTSLSPKFSKETLEKMIVHFNQFMKERDIKDSTSSLIYLQKELAKADYKEVRTALQQILEEQYKKLALANTRDEYALRFIEAPLFAANKSAPKRAFICAAITFFGTAFTVFLLWSVRAYRLGKTE